MKNEDENISALQGLGPRSQEMLSRAGIKSVDQLKELGSLKAYMLAKASNPNVSLNLLWALEGALTGVSWKEIARNHRTSFILAIEEYEKKFPQ